MDRTPENNNNAKSRIISRASTSSAFLSTRQNNNNISTSTSTATSSVTSSTQKKYFYGCYFKGCHFVGKDARVINSHYSRSHINLDQKPYRCAWKPFCHVVFRSKTVKNVMEHVKTFHKSDNPENYVEYSPINYQRLTSNSPSEDLYGSPATINNCDKPTLSKNTNFMENNSSSLTTDKSIVRHKLSLIKKPESIKRSLFYCYACSKTFKLQSGLTNHKTGNLHKQRVRELSGIASKQPVSQSSIKLESSPNSLIQSEESTSPIFEFSENSIAPKQSIPQSSTFESTASSTSLTTKTTLKPTILIPFITMINKQSVPPSASKESDANQQPIGTADKSNHNSVIFRQLNTSNENNNSNFLLHQMGNFEKQNFQQMEQKENNETSGILPQTLIARKPPASMPNPRPRRVHCTFDGKLCKTQFSSNIKQKTKYHIYKQHLKVPQMKKDRLRLHFPEPNIDMHYLDLFPNNQWDATAFEQLLQLKALAGVPVHFETHQDNDENSLQPIDMHLCQNESIKLTKADQQEVKSIVLNQSSDLINIKDEEEDEVIFSKIPQTIHNNPFDDDYNMSDDGSFIDEASDYELMESYYTDQETPLEPGST